jgi:hypothetical protein
LKYYSALMDWRSGKAVDLPGRFGPLNAPGLDAYKLQMALEFYLQQGDKIALKQLIAGRNEDDFLRPMVLATYLKALRTLGLEDAALVRAKDAAHAELGKAVVVSWARPEREQAVPVFALAEALKEPAAYPRAWVDYLLGQLRNENARDLVKFEDAQLQEDWPALLAAADSFLSRNPTEYDFYWPKARALIQLGRMQEAAAPLRVYLKYAHNDADYAEAAQWLAKIEAMPPSTAFHGKH